MKNIKYRKNWYYCSKLAEYDNVIENNKELEGILQNGIVNVLNLLEVKSYSPMKLERI